MSGCLKNIYAWMSKRYICRECHIRQYPVSVNQGNPWNLLKPKNRCLCYMIYHPKKVNMCLTNDASGRDFVNMLAILRADATF